jgi:ketosteroid isomerase-like protein
MDENRLRAFVNAYLKQDIDTVMDYITDDCLYITTTGPGPGTVYTGKEQVRRGFVEVMTADDDGSTLDVGELFVSGNRGVSEWSIRVGDKVVMRGCDLYVFAGDKICRKDVFRKVMA